MPAATSITVAIPAFNVENHLGAALRSLASQTLAPQEIIVVDDGSTDQTKEIARRFPEVRLLVHPENLGIAAARNTAWRAAGSEIVVYLDADATAGPEFLAEILAGYCAADIAGVGGRGLEMIRESRADRWRREVLYQEWGDAFRAEVPFLFGMSSSYRRQVLAELGGFSPLYKTSGEDMDFSFRVRRRGYRLSYNPRALVHHQRSDDRQSIEKMTYRHCYWGFVAQRRNHCYDNKTSIIASGLTFLRHLLVDGLAGRDRRYAMMSLQLHGVILKAWRDSRRFIAEMAPETTPPC